MVLDVGNTRIKWGVHGEGGWQQRGVMATHGGADSISSWQSLPTPHRIVGSNVAGSAAVAALTDYWKGRGRDIEWVRAPRACCGVVNGYDEPAALGSDRFAALVGAWHRMRRACLVVSAGTAVTLDMLDMQGRFLGGEILPGRQLTLNSLVAGTHALQYANGRVQACPRNTADGLASGVAHMLACAVASASSRLEAMVGIKPGCVITGGDAEWLAEQLNLECSLVPGLVMDGLVRMAEEESCS